MEVTVLPPGEPPRKRSVGRRYSNFVMLYRKLQEELGPGVMGGLEPPPKHSLMAVNRHRELVEQRRWELEQWLWRLSEVPRIAASKALYEFSELDTAARMIGPHAPDGDAQGSSSGRPRLPVSTPPRGADLAAVTAPPHRSTPGRTAAQSGGHPSPPASPVAGVHSTDGRDVAAPVPPLRLTMHVEERTRLQRLIAALQSRLDTATDDIEAAARMMQADRATIAALAARVDELEEVARGPTADAARGRETPGTAEEAVGARATEAELDTERRRSAELAGRAADLEARLEAEVARREEALRSADAAAARAGQELERARADAQAARREAEERAAVREREAAAQTRRNHKLLAQEIRDLRGTLAAVSGAAVDAMHEARDVARGVEELLGSQPGAATARGGDVVQSAWAAGSRLREIDGGGAELKDAAADLAAALTSLATAVDAAAATARHQPEADGRDVRKEAAPSPPNAGVDATRASDAVLEPLASSPTQPFDTQEAIGAGGLDPLSDDETEMAPDDAAEASPMPAELARGTASLI